MPSSAPMTSIWLATTGTPLFLQPTSGSPVQLAHACTAAMAKDATLIVSLFTSSNSTIVLTTPFSSLPRMRLKRQRQRPRQHALYHLQQRHSELHRSINVLPLCRQCLHRLRRRWHHRIHKRRQSPSLPVHLPTHRHHRQLSPQLRELHPGHTGCRSLLRGQQRVHSCAQRGRS